MIRTKKLRSLSIAILAVVTAVTFALGITVFARNGKSVTKVSAADTTAPDTPIFDDIVTFDSDIGSLSTQTTYYYKGIKIYAYSSQTSKSSSVDFNPTASSPGYYAGQAKASGNDITGLAIQQGTIAIPMNAAGTYVITFRANTDENIVTKNTNFKVGIDNVNYSVAYTSSNYKTGTALTTANVVASTGTTGQFTATYVAGESDVGKVFKFYHGSSGTGEGKFFVFESVSFESAATKYDVTFDSMGGSSVAAQKVVEGEKASEPDAPTKTGYTFEAWRNSADDEIFDFDTEINQSYDLYATWTANGYDLSYDANGGEGATEATNITFGTTGKVAANGFTRENHSFIGWNTQADGNGVDYAAGDDYTMNTEGATLYAQWKDDSVTYHTVNVSIDDKTPYGSLNKSSFEVAEGTTFTALGDTIEFSDSTIITVTAEDTEIYAYTYLWDKTSGTVEDDYAIVVTLQRVYILNDFEVSYNVWDGASLASVIGAGDTFEVIIAKAAHEVDVVWADYEEGDATVTGTVVTEGYQAATVTANISYVNTVRSIKFDEFGWTTTASQDGTSTGVIEEKLNEYGYYITKGGWEYECNDGNKTNYHYLGIKGNLNELTFTLKTDATVTFSLGGNGNGRWSLDGSDVGKAVADVYVYVANLSAGKHVLASTVSGKNQFLRSINIDYGDSVEYIADGGAGLAGNVYFPATTATVAGKQFRGWTKDGGVTVVAPGTLVTEAEKEGGNYYFGSVYTALFTENVVTLNDGESLRYGYADDSFTLPALKGLDGYTAIGWTKGEDIIAAGTEVEVDGATYTAVYADFVTYTDVKLTEGFGTRYGVKVVVYGDAASGKAVLDELGVTEVNVKLSFVVDEKTCSRRATFAVVNELDDFALVLTGNPGAYIDKSITATFTLGEIVVSTEAATATQIAQATYDAATADQKAEFGEGLAQYYGITL